MRTQLDFKSSKKSLIQNKLRQIEGIELKKPEIDDSYHSSVVDSSKNSSIRNVVNSSYFNSEKDMSFYGSNHTNSRVSSRLLPGLNQKQRKLSGKSLTNSQISHITNRSNSGQKQIFQKNHKQSNKQIKLEQLFSKYIDTSFIQSLMSFINKDWAEQEALLLKDKRFEALKNAIIQKTNLINNLVQEFMVLEYEKYEQKERKLVFSLLMKLNSQTLQQYEGIFIEILKKIPQQKIVKQQAQIEQLYSKIIDIFDPKYISSIDKMKERGQLFMQGYTVQKNNLIAALIIKLKPQVDFMCEIQKYLTSYQKELIRVRNQLQASQLQRNKVNVLLKKKTNFTPIQIDFDRLKELKDESQRQFFQKLEGNYVKFHEQHHKKNQKNIKDQIKQNECLKAQIETLKAKIEEFQNQIETIKSSIPKKQQKGVQVYFFNQSKSIESQSIPSPLLSNFLSNVSTPFNFTQKITSSLLNLISIDKVLHDYDLIRNKQQLQSFSDFLVTWFLIRTGSKKIAQIFTKNFVYSIKQLKNKHKRFHIFSRICGFNGFKKKSVQEDLVEIFFGTHRAWYLLVKLGINYRKKVNQNPSGFHLFPPIQCEGIFKLPLRKVYELIEQFLKMQGMEIPHNLNNQIDFYSINEISKFKSHDEEFQKGQLQQIHILREINFDIVAGFVIEFIAKEKCTVLEQFLRAVTMKQKEIGNVLGYHEFELIYKKFYKEKRSKIENIYSKICLVNQHDMMDIQNAQVIIRAIVQDQSPLRNIFDELQSFKALIFSEKSNLRGERTQPNINSFENFRERYYFEFYDFLNTTCFLEEVYRVIKVLIKKKLKNWMKNDEEIEKLIAEKQQPAEEPQQKQGLIKEKEDSDSDQYSEKDSKIIPNKQAILQDPSKKKSELQNKVEEWSKIIIRVPHFANRILTIDQILVHNMRRKEMIEASQFAWRTLRDILVIIAKQ